MLIRDVRHHRSRRNERLHNARAADQVHDRYEWHEQRIAVLGEPPQQAKDGWRELKIVYQAVPRTTDGRLSKRSLIARAKGAPTSMPTAGASDTRSSSSLLNSQK